MTALSSAFNILARKTGPEKAWHALVALITDRPWAHAKEGPLPKTLNELYQSEGSFFAPCWTKWEAFNPETLHEVVELIGDRSKHQEGLLSDLLDVRREVHLLDTGNNLPTFEEAKLLLSAGNLNGDLSVYDPFCSDGYLIGLMAGVEGLRFTGQSGEALRYQTALRLARLSSGRPRFHLSDAIENPLFFESGALRTFDRVLARFPHPGNGYGLGFDETDPFRRTREFSPSDYEFSPKLSAMIIHCFESLNENGEAHIITPLPSSFSDRETVIDHMIRKGYVQSVSSTGEGRYLINIHRNPTDSPLVVATASKEGVNADRDLTESVREGKHVKGEFIVDTVSRSSNWLDYLSGTEFIRGLSGRSSGKASGPCEEIKVEADPVVLDEIFWFTTSLGMVSPVFHSEGTQPEGLEVVVPGTSPGFSWSPNASEGLYVRPGDLVIETDGDNREQVFLVERPAHAAFGVTRARIKDEWRDKLLPEFALILLRDNSDHWISDGYCTREELAYRIPDIEEQRRIVELGWARPFATRHEPVSIRIQELVSSAGKFAIEDVANPTDERGGRLRAWTVDPEKANPELVEEMLYLRQNRLSLDGVRFDLPSREEQDRMAAELANEQAESRKYRKASDQAVDAYKKTIVGLRGRGKLVTARYKDLFFSNEITVSEESLDGEVEVGDQVRVYNQFDEIFRKGEVTAIMDGKCTIEVKS